MSRSVIMSISLTHHSLEKQKYCSRHHTCVRIIATCSSIDAVDSSDAYNIIINTKRADL